MLRSDEKIPSAALRIDHIVEQHRLALETQPPEDRLCGSLIESHTQ